MRCPVPLIALSDSFPTPHWAGANTNRNPPRLTLLQGPLLYVVNNIGNRGEAIFTLSALPFLEKHQKTRRTLWGQPEQSHASWICGLSVTQLLLFRSNASQLAKINQPRVRFRAQCMNWTKCFMRSHSWSRTICFLGLQRCGNQGSLSYN